MTANLATASIKAADQSVTRTLAAHLGDVINVKGFGALGNGLADDTAFIQAALDAAFGPTNAPHGDANKSLNRPVFFPAGHYRVSAPAALTVSGAVSNGGLIKLTVNSTTNYRSGQLCFVTGVGGITDRGVAVNLNYGITVDDATHITLRDTVFGGTYTSGGSVKRAALQITDVVGGHVFGAGRDTTAVSVLANTDSILAINGMGRSRLERMMFSGAAGATNICMDLDWDRTGQSTQGNTFYDMAFNDAGYGARLGAHGQQVSENIFINCAISGHDIAGILIGNQNAVQMSVIGGNISGCLKGIHVTTGSCPVIFGVGFQNGTGTDIWVDGSSQDTYFIGACRTESSNFAHIQAGPGVVIAGCTQIAAAVGEFLFYESGAVNSCVLDACYSLNGIIHASSNGKIYIRGGKFNNAGFLPAGLAGQIMEYSLPPTTVALLPSARASFKGLRQMVTDSNATTATGHGNTVASGGSNICPVYCDGTAWKIG